MTRDRLERILKPDQWSDFVADAVAVEREEYIRVYEEPAEYVHLRADRPVQLLKRIAEERDVRKHRDAVERVKVFLPQALGVDDVTAEEIECEREVWVDGDVGAHGVLRLVGKVPRGSCRRIARKHAGPVPLITEVHVRRDALIRRRKDGERLNPRRARAEQVHLVARRQTH